MRGVFFLLLLIFINSAVAAQPVKLVIPSGHSDNVRAIAVTPDNKYLISSAADQTTRIWENATGRLVYTFEKGSRKFMINQFLFRKDGKELIALGGGGIYIFDFDKFVITQTIELTNGTCMVLSADDRSLYVSRRLTDKSLCVALVNLDDFSSKTIYTYPFSYWDTQVRKLSLNAAENRLLCYMGTQGSIIIDTSGKEIENFSNKPAQPHTWGFAPDGSLLTIQEIGGYAYSIRFLDAETKAAKWEPAVKLSGNFNYLYGAQVGVFDKKTGRFAIGSSKDFVVLDYMNKTASPVYVVPRGELSAIAFSPKAQTFIIGTNMYAAGAVYLYSYNAADNTTGSNFGDAVLYARAVKTPVSNTAILLGSFKKYFKQLNITHAGFTVKNLSLNYESEYIAISPDGKTGANATRDFINLYNTERPGDGYQTINTPGNEAGVKEIVFSKDGKLLATIGDKEVQIVNVADKKVLYKYPSGYYSLAAKSGIGLFSSDNKKLLSYYNGQDNKGTVVCFSIEEGRKLWERKGECYSFKFSPDNASVFCIDHYSKDALWLDAATGNLLNKKSFPGNDKLYNAVVTDDFRTLLINREEGDIDIFDLATLTKTGTLKGHTAWVGYTAFLDNEKYLVSTSADNTTRIWDWKNQKELCKLIFFEETEGWVVFTPDGRFDASDDLLKKMYYVKGKEIIPLEVLYEQFYTPMLVTRVFSGEQFTPLPVDIDNIKRAPKVKINYAAVQRNLEVDSDKPIYQNTTGTASLTVEAADDDDIIDEIRLFHNGKILNMATRNLVVADDGQKTITRKYTVDLQPGENTFRAVALNSQRTESQPAEIGVRYAKNNNNNASAVVISATGPLNIIDKSATLHLVVVGINQYQNPSMRLTYAMADATAFKNAIEADAKTIISRVETYFVADDKAIRSGIIEAFNKVQQKAKPQDVFIFYYAGHGVIAKDNEFYLVPADVSDLKNVDEALQKQGLAAKTLQQYAIDIQSQNQLFILDACQSAGAFEKLLSNTGNQQKAMAVVARTTGTHWMAASGSQQFANELASLGHGAYTYVLLEALKGAAASSGMITVNGLKNYLQAQMPELMKKYNGSQQTPASYGFGNDFPVELMK